MVSPPTTPTTTTHHNDHHHPPPTTNTHHTHHQTITIISAISSILPLLWCICFSNGQPSTACHIAVWWYWIVSWPGLSCRYRENIEYFWCHCGTGMLLNQSCPDTRGIMVSHFGVVSMEGHDARHGTMTTTLHKQWSICSTFHKICYAFSWLIYRWVNARKT